MTGTPFDLYPAITEPVEASDTLLVLDVSDQSVSPSGKVKQPTVSQFGASLIGIALPIYKPNGTDDTSAINAQLAAGDPVWLLPYQLAGQYVITEPINEFVTGSQLYGFEAWAASEKDNYGAGTGQPGGSVISMANAFPTGEYAIDLNNTTSTQMYGVDIAALSIYGEALPAHTVNTAGGIRIHGAVGAGFIRHVAVLGTNGDGLHCEVDDGTGYVPDEWRFEWVKITGSYGGYGLWADNLPDSSLLHVQTTGNALDGTCLGWSTNTRLDHHKSENNTQCGYHFTGTGGTGDVMWLTTCTSHLNGYDGMLFDHTTPGEGGAGTYQLANCGMVNDGQAGGTTYAGYRSNGCTDRIMAVGCSSQQAYYGAAEIGGSYGMCFTASWLSGTGANTYDDGSNTHVLVNQSPVPW